MSLPDVSGIFEKMRKDKKTLITVILGVLGLILIMLSAFPESDGEISSSECSSQYDLESVRQMEVSLQELISSINGVGKTKVMITYESSDEAVYASDEDNDFSGEKSSSEKKHIIIDSKSGETGLRTKTVCPKVRGVAVVCKGGENPIIKEQIINTVSALFNISSNKITVADMAE